MPLLNRSADRFQRALEGERVADPQLEQLVRTSHQLAGAGARVSGPDPQFVAALRTRLMAEAERMPAPSPTAAKAAAARRAAARTTPVVVVLGRGTPRLLAGVAASAVLVGGIVGAASRSAVPGQALYPVKSWLDGVQVRLADNDLDRGRTYLDQAQEHISDARDLAEHQSPHDNVDVALKAAITSVRRGQQSLDTAYATTGNPQALISMRDFTARALPQVDVLRREVPQQSIPLVAELESLLLQSQQQTARRIAACGSPCSELASTIGPATLPSLTTSAAPSATSSTRPSGTPTVVASVPRASATQSGSGAGGSLTGPSASVGVGGVTAGAGGGGITAGTGGVGVGLPTVSATVPLPSVSATVPLPSATLGTGGVSATVPSSTLGPVTLPGVTVTLP
ncbi:DUF5667 domain-containing protein [Phycicoccus sp. 3266]|uniref:DUF5667 domain-containing protein n=1 Tax=Phycicoccus sp. 3266 TaxID=2817751 RepID=UPI00286275A1|nr:DUF5667 domain-containing protein [Phycicoccus sp. 3266]MDR6863743.1 hypothetical protein [Phycicoccus sp. 3266]